MAHYSIEPERRTLHARFSKEAAPVLTIDPGDSVTFRTLDAGWGLEPPHLDGSPRLKFQPHNPETDSGHALCGPIAIRGAEPGQTLEIQIDEIIPGAWGWTVAGGWDSPVNQRLGLLEGENRFVWALDSTTMTGRNQFGHTLPLRPFMGVMGMPSADSEPHSTWYPRVQGGNIDCKEFVAGSAVYFPIAVSGGLFSVGDGHAAQGDGEVSGTAIECPMERVTLTFRVREDMPLQTPMANTPVGWLTLGFHEDLNEATLIALEAMVDWLQARHNLSRPHALGLASLAVDFRITQIVNGVRGVHATLPHNVLH